MAFDGLEFKWTAGVFGTNNAHMDDEHAGLFTAIDRLDAERSLEAYEALAGLVIQHFKDEEAECGLSDEHKVSLLLFLPPPSFPCLALPCCCFDLMFAVSFFVFVATTR